jgi:hypothetical protein
MDIRDFLTKIDAIQSKEQMKEDVKKIHLKEASQVMLYGDTPEDMAAIAQIFKSAGVPEPKEKEMTIPLPTPKPEAEAEVKAVEEVPGKASTTPDPEYKDTQYMTKDLSGGINKIKKTYPKVAGGDNQRALEKTEEEVQSSIKETLLQAYQDFKKNA